MNGNVSSPQQRCQRSKRQLRHAFGKVRTISARSLFSSLRFLARLGSVMLFLQPHLSWGCFFLLSAVSTLSTLPAGSAGASRGASKQPALAAAQGLNAAVGTLFLAPSGAPGCKMGIFGCTSKGLDPHLLPRVSLSLSRSPAHPWGQGQLLLRPRGCGQLEDFGDPRLWVCMAALQRGQSRPSSFLFSGESR